MPLTTLKMEKLRWLVNSAGFRRNPCGVIYRVFLWEIFRWLKLEIPYVYDNQFQILLRPNEGVSRLVYYFGVSEPELFDFYNAFLRPGMTVLDIGANIGLHALYMAKRVLPGGQIHSFEPSPTIFVRLQHHADASKLPNIFCHPFALGAAEGEAFFHQNNSDTSRSFISQAPSGERVGIRTLDAVAKEYQWSMVHFLKLDVEGFELGVLQGAHDCLSRKLIEVIQVELDGQSLARNTTDAESVFSFLTKRGYVYAGWDFHQKVFQARHGVEGLDYNSFFVLPHMVFPSCGLPTPSG